LKGLEKEKIENPEKKRKGGSKKCIGVKEQEIRRVGGVGGET